MTSADATASRGGIVPIASRRQDILTATLLPIPPCLSWGHILFTLNLSRRAVNGRGGQPGYSPVGLRRRFVLARRCLAASLRSTDALVGFVGRRGGAGGAVASVSSSESLAAAASRLRNCDRCSDAATVITPFVSRRASARIARSLSGWGSAVDAARS